MTSVNQKPNICHHRSSITLRDEEIKRSERRIEQGDGRMNESVSKHTHKKCTRVQKKGKEKLVI